ncbi:hypothetical protein H5410_036175 [Solanum commersonii]|uniref:Uncharacterized protein n=1 Tax=Solanum commersonii TaxID=4109 RepID=A0A9J5Y4X1_SOLCO|nr:hypothetical protein H5410_036175 [Solanum commersonii]
MEKFRNNKRWRYWYGNLMTQFIRREGVVEEYDDLCPLKVPYLVLKLVDVTKNKAQDTSHGPVLSTADHQTWDDSWMGPMFSMDTLQ